MTDGLGIWPVRVEAEALGARLAQQLGGELVRPWEQGGARKELFQEQFGQRTQWVLIMATGIATRFVDGLLKDKHQDPAVVVLDEAGRYAIALVGGHEAGANALTYRVANAVGAIPVVTTATEATRRFVVGVGCRKGVSEEQVESAVRAALERASNDRAERVRLAGGEAGAASGAVAGAASGAAAGAGREADRDAVAAGEVAPDAASSAAAGAPSGVMAGAASGAAAGAGREADRDAVAAGEVVPDVASGVVAGADREAAGGDRGATGGAVGLADIRELVTVDLKAGEPGLLAFSRRQGIPLRVIAKRQIEARAWVTRPSEWVRQSVGLDGVCEPCALIACTRGRLVVPKMTLDGVAVAVVEDSWELGS